MCESSPIARSYVSELYIFFFVFCFVSMSESDESVYVQPIFFSITEKNEFSSRVATNMTDYRELFNFRLLLNGSIWIKLAYSNEILCAHSSYAISTRLENIERASKLMIGKLPTERSLNFHEIAGNFHDATTNSSRRLVFLLFTRKFCWRNFLFFLVLARWRFPQKWQSLCRWEHWARNN